MGCASWWSCSGSRVALELVLSGIMSDLGEVGLGEVLWVLRWGGVGLCRSEEVLELGCVDQGWEWSRTVWRWSGTECGWNGTGVRLEGLEWPGMELCGLRWDWIGVVWGSDGTGVELCGSG